MGFGTRVIVRAGKIKFELVAGAIVPITALLVITVVRFGLADGLMATALFVGCLLAHEAAHMLAALVTGTRFSAMGFCLRGAYIRRERARGIVELVISGAGPAVNLLLAAFLWRSQGILGWLAQMNAGLALINLLPLRGSDGQRIVSELWSIVRGTPVISPGPIPVSADVILERNGSLTGETLDGV